MNEPFQGCAEIFAYGVTLASAVNAARERVYASGDVLYVDWYPEGEFWIVWQWVPNFSMPKTEGTLMRIDLRKVPKRMQTVVRPRKFK